MKTIGKLDSELMKVCLILGSLAACSPRRDDQPAAPTTAEDPTMAPLAPEQTASPPLPSGAGGFHVPFDDTNATPTSATGHSEDVSRPAASAGSELDGTTPAAHDGSTSDHDVTTVDLGVSGEHPASSGEASSASPGPTDGPADQLPPPRPDGPAPRHGERYPFPQSAGYPFGVASSRISNEHVRGWYDSWSTKYLQACNDALRPGVDPLSRSLVEAQGFAMVAAAYMGDRPTFDRLNTFYERKLTAYGCGLMGWDNTCEGFTDQGAATDGDIDVASALIVAHWQWPGEGYDDKARDVIENLRPMIVDCGGTYALHPGCAGETPWGGCDETDASYYSPAFFRYFADFSGDDAWRKLADDSHVIRDAAAHPSTGLVPDWQSVSGRPGAGERKDFFSFDAIRTPYKHALDYLWHGNEAAREWCVKITSWAHDEVGVENLVDGYELDGTRVGQYHNLAVVGAMAVCSLANTQLVADAFVAESVRMRDDFWYSAYLGNLYLLAMSGNMWTPETLRAAPWQ